MFGFVGRWRPLLYCVFAFYESNLTYVTVPFILLPLKFPPWVDLPIHGLYAESNQTEHLSNPILPYFHDGCHLAMQEYELHHRHDY